MRRRSKAAKAFAVSAACYFVAVSAAPSCAVLIDDFSVDQVGISGNDPNTVYDAVQSPQIFGGNRVIWGDGPATVTEGRLFIGPGTIQLDRGSVSWSGVASEEPTGRGLTADLSSYTGLEVYIAEIAGTVQTRFSIGSGTNGWARKDMFFNSTGRHTIYFSSLIPEQALLNLHDVRNITFSTLVDAGEYVAFDSVHIVVPEPSTLLLGVLLTAVSCIWYRQAQRTRLRFAGYHLGRL
jgi:hypothetical protein